MIRLDAKVSSNDVIVNFFTSLAKASFFIWDYLASVSDIDLDAYITGFLDSSNFWKNTAPNPNDNASADTLISAL